jgi:hypothetical protein
MRIMSIEKKPAPNAALMEISAARLHVIYGYFEKCDFGEK